MKSIYDAEGLQQKFGLLETQNGEKLYHWGSGNWSRVPLQGNFKDIKKKWFYTCCQKVTYQDHKTLCSCFLIVFLTKPKLQRVKNTVWEWGRQNNETAVQKICPSSPLKISSWERGGVLKWITSIGVYLILQKISGTTDMRMSEHWNNQQKSMTPTSDFIQGQKRMIPRSSFERLAGKKII